jgi:hypothetical protein
MRERRRRSRGQGKTPLSRETHNLPPRKKWGEMNLAERTAWIEEKFAWMTEKRQREQDYLDWRNADLKTDRDYRADAVHELDLLAMFAEWEEAEQEGKVE